MKGGRRMREFFAALVADPYRKLAAIVLGFGFWFFINGQITDSEERVVALTWGSGQSGLASADQKLNQLNVELPTDRVVGLRFMDGETQITAATITLKGPRFRLNELRRNGEVLTLRVTGFMGQNLQNRRDIEFTAANIRRDSWAVTADEIEMEPKRIRLEIESIVDEEIPLTNDVVELLVDPELESRLQPETAAFSPPRARILGPASSIAQLRKPGPRWMQARLKMSGGDRRQVTAVIDLTAAAKQHGLSFAETPSVTYQVRPQTDVFEFDLPVVVDDLALLPEMRGLYRPDQPSRLVRIFAGGQLSTHLKTTPPQKQKEWASACLRLHVYIPPLEPGAYPQEIVREARLQLLGPLLSAVDRSEYLLADTVSVTLRRTP